MYGGVLTWYWGAIYLEHVTKEVRVVVWPIGSSNERNDLHNLVANERWHGGVMTKQVRGQKVTKLHPLGGVN